MMFGIGDEIKADTQIDITERGNQVSVKFSPTVKWAKILAELRQSQRPMSIAELSKETDLDINETKQLARELKSKKLVMIV